MPYCRTLNPEHRTDCFPRSVSKRVTRPRKEGKGLKAETREEWGLAGRAVGGREEGPSPPRWKFLPDLIIPGVISNQSKTSEHMFCVDSGPLIKTAPVKNSLIKRKVVLKEQFDCRLTWVGRGQLVPCLGLQANPVPGPALGIRQHARPLSSLWLAHSSEAIAFPFLRPENPSEGFRGRCPAGSRVTATHSAGLLWRSFHLRAILLVLMNQNVLSVIETICFLYTCLLGKPVVLGTLSVWLKGTAA